MTKTPKLTKRKLVRTILRVNPDMTPAQVNEEMVREFGVSLASGWLQIYCREERPKRPPPQNPVNSCLS